MSDALITLNNISLSHNGKNVLDDVSFKLHEGEFITLIGPNGAGKSSLIKVLLGVIKQDSGDITYTDNIRLGYTPQTFSANPFIPISVKDFLTLNQKLDSEFMLKTFELTGIKDLLKSPLKNLSGGELQKVLLTRALLNKPNVLILDEPAQNLDVENDVSVFFTFEKESNFSLTLARISCGTVASAPIKSELIDSRVLTTVSSATRESNPCSGFTSESTVVVNCLLASVVLDSNERDNSRVVDCIRSISADVEPSW